MKPQVMSPIEWMTPDAFQSMYEVTYKPAHVTLDQEMSAAVTIEEVRAQIGNESAVNPTDAGDEPGPCVRWYGRAYDTPFFITGYASQDFSVLTTRRDSDTYAWAVLFELLDLRWFWSQLMWLRAFGEGSPTDAVCRLDRWGVRHQVYQSDALETTLLLKCLNGITLPKLFFGCQPDPVDSRWAVYDVNRSRLGMYTRRDSAEDVARKESERIPLEICVIEEPVGRVWSRFSAGRILYVATPPPRRVAERETVNRR